MIDLVTGNKPLPATIRLDIIERTDGIPLFVEEMTKAVLEAGGQAREAMREAGLPSRDVKHCYMVVRGSVWSPGVVARTGFSNESPMHHRLRANGPINATAVALNNGLSVRGPAADLRRTELFKE